MRRIGEEKKGEKMVWVRLENRGTKMESARKKEKPAGQKDKDIGGHDMEREKDKIETARNSKVGREKGTMDRLWLRQKRIKVEEK